MKIIFFCLLLAVSVTGCGAGSGSGLDNQGIPVTEPGKPNTGDTNNTTATLTQIQQTIFGAICSRCHTGASAPHGLRLDSEENSYAFLVSHAADEIPTLLRVNPGRPDESYIVQKIEGAPGIIGSQMPLGGPYLTEAQITLIRDWIANGAPRTGTGTNGSRISQAKSKKINDNFIATLHFSKTIQLESFTKNSIQVFYTTENKREQVDNFSTLLVGKTLEIKLKDIPTDATGIEILVNDSALVAILDNEGRAIDGDNDGVDGGSYRYVYTF